MSRRLNRCSLKINGTYSEQWTLGNHKYTYHAIDAILVAGELCDLYGIVWIWNVPNTNIGHVSAFASCQKSAIPWEGQGRHRFPTSVQNVSLGVFPWIEQHDSTTEKVNISLFYWTKHEIRKSVVNSLTYFLS